MKVMSWNTLYGGLDGGDERRLKLQAETIADVKPDILLIQEAKRFELVYVDKRRLPHFRGRDVEEATERKRGFVVPGGYSPKMLEPIEHALDAVAVTISHKIAGYGLLPICL